MAVAILLIGACGLTLAQESLEDTWARIGSTWTQKTDMPTARFIAGSAVVDGKIYVVGGNPHTGGGSLITNIMEEYDPAADTWTRRANMPTARQGVRAAAVDGIVYAIGGNGGAYNDVAYANVEAYDPTTNTWTTKTDMPTPRSIPAIATVDGKVYVIGGHVLSTVEVYDPATDTWTKKADMPTARWSPAADVVDGKIYVFGGGTTWLGNFPPFNETPIVEVYDPATDAWTRVSDMPRARFALSATAVGGKIYIIGGADADVHMPPSLGFEMVDVYDPATDTWTMAADPPFVAPYPNTGVVDGKIYTIGGWGGPGGEIFPTVQEFTPAPEAKNLMAFNGEILMSKSADLTQADIPTDFYNRVTELNGAEPSFIELWTGQGTSYVAYVGAEFTSEIQVLGYLVLSPRKVIGVKTWELETMTMANGDQLFFENAVTVDFNPPNPSSVSIVKTITGGTGEYKDALGFADGTGTENDSGARHTFFGGLISTAFVVLNVPDESPGAPWYAGLSRGFIPTDGTQAAIVFVRDPACIPPEFNLLDLEDIPAVFACPILFRGQEWWHEPFVDFPFKYMYVNDGSVPVYFVDLAELNSEIADDQLTLGELQAFSSLKVGQATYVKDDVLNTNAPDSDGKGHGALTAIGTLQDSGELFYVHWHEEFLPATGKNALLDIAIEFFPGAMAGDVNHDGVVDFFDLAALGENWLRQEP
jgi:N-acetylneuraminic acid mutarotase